MTKISIVVICHNNDRLNLVIDALLRQRITGDEIIIVNDNSDESHLNILLKYSNTEKKIILNSDQIE